MTLTVKRVVGRHESFFSSSSSSSCLRNPFGVCLTKSKNYATASSSTGKKITIFFQFLRRNRGLQHRFGFLTAGKVACCLESFNRCSTRFWSPKFDRVDQHRWCSLQEAAVFKPMLSTRWRNCDINDLNHLDRIHDARWGWKNYIVFVCSRVLSEFLQDGVLWKADFSALPSFTRFLYPECQSGIWCNRTF